MCIIKQATPVAISILRGDKPVVPVLPRPMNSIFIGFDLMLLLGRLVQLDLSKMQRVYSERHRKGFACDCHESDSFH